MTTNLKQTSVVELPDAFTVRGAGFDDIERSSRLISRWSKSTIGWDESASLEDVLREWQTPGFNPAEDIRLVFAPNGDLAGYIETWTTMKPAIHPGIWGRVDPDYEGMGIGTWMLQWAESHVLRVLPSLPAEYRFAPQVGVWHTASKSKKLFEDFGYQYVRTFYHMLIELDAPVPEPEFPTGITLRTYNPATDVDALYQADQDAFRDHLGFVEQTYEEGLARFKHRWLENEDVDPTLLFLAMDGDQIAGFNLCRPNAYDDTEMGWVGSLGVLRPWRKRGIGLALLRQAFNEFYRRGKRKVGLGVDAQNLTGALQLYEHAGMHVNRAFDNYEKEIRPGSEISVQTLS
jgi:mycothiol synthase